MPRGGARSRRPVSQDVARAQPAWVRMPPVSAPVCFGVVPSSGCSFCPSVSVGTEPDMPSRGCSAALAWPFCCSSSWCGIASLLSQTLPWDRARAVPALSAAGIADHEALLRRALDTFGRLDALAHLAGVIVRRADLDEVTEADWDTQLDVNLKASFFLNRAAARLFREQGRGGRIVNFTSQAWWTGGFGGSVVYAASKGGIVSMSRGLARTYASHGITVNTVAPGAADTAMFSGNQSPEQIESFVRGIPLGRIAAPEELVGAVLFLCS